MTAYTLAWSKRPKSHLKVFKPSTGLTREDIKSMFKIQWVRDDAFGWPFSWGRSAQERGGAPTRLFYLGFFRWLSANVMSLRWDPDLFFVYVEPSHAICVTLCLVADISHQLEHVFAVICWYLLHLTSLHHCFARSFPNHVFFGHIRPICRSR